jgi:transposase
MHGFGSCLKEACIPFQDCSRTCHQPAIMGSRSLCPTRDDYHWQARDGTGFAAEYFAVDWQKECAVCTAGKVSSSWSLVEDRRGNPVIKIKFAMQDCRPCPQRQQCTHTQSVSPRRVLTVRPELQYQAL